MAAPGFATMISTDWSAPCITEFFCFGCASPLCAHCCDRHAHRAVHHPHAAGDPLRVERIVGGRLAVDATDMRGCGYDLTGIQRIPDQGRKFILLLPVAGNDDRCRGQCLACPHHIRRGASYCSLGCKVTVAQGGRRRHVAQLMVHLAGQGQFGPPVLVKDRFCTVCRLAFSSASCPEHHHPVYPAAGPDAVKTILHLDGWAAIPQGQLPGDLVQDVQVLHHPDGGLVYPIHRTQQPMPAPPVIHVGAPHGCHRAGCNELFHGLERFCSLRCRHA